MCVNELFLSHFPLAKLWTLSSLPLQKEGLNVDDFQF